MSLAAKILRGIEKIATRKYKPDLNDKLRYYIFAIIFMNLIDCEM